MVKHLGFSHGCRVDPGGQVVLLAEDLDLVDPERRVVDQLMEDRRGPHALLTPAERRLPEQSVVSTGGPTARDHDQEHDPWTYEINHNQHGEQQEGLRGGDEERANHSVNQSLGLHADHVRQRPGALLPEVEDRSMNVGAVKRADQLAIVVHRELDIVIVADVEHHVLRDVKKGDGAQDDPQLDARVVDERRRERQVRNEVAERFPLSGPQRQDERIENRESAHLQDP